MVTTVGLRARLPASYTSDHGLFEPSIYANTLTGCLNWDAALASRSFSGEPPNRPNTLTTDHNGSRPLQTRATPDISHSVPIVMVILSLNRTTCSGTNSNHLFQNEIERTLQIQATGAWARQTYHHSLLWFSLDLPPVALPTNVTERSSESQVHSRGVPFTLPYSVPEGDIGFRVLPDVFRPNLYQTRYGWTSSASPEQYMSPDSPALFHDAASSSADRPFYGVSGLEQIDRF